MDQNSAPVMCGEYCCADHGVSFGGFPFQSISMAIPAHEPGSHTDRYSGDVLGKRPTFLWNSSIHRKYAVKVSHLDPKGS